jgi:hypothetical protein
MVGGAALMIAAVGSGWAAAGALAAPPSPVGVVPTGRPAIEVVGQSLQSGDAFVTVGYVTHLAGVPDAQLFSDPAIRDEKHARLVFADQSAVTARSTLQNQFVLTLSGATTMRWQTTPSSSFANPASFLAGRAVAVFRTRTHDVVNAIAPNSGIATAVEELSQRTAKKIPVSGKSRPLGKVGMHLRLDGTGAAVRSSITPTISSTVFSGVAVATD